MTYDMRGNKGSEGDIANFSRTDFLNDACVAYDYLKKQVDEKTKIGLVGSSFGSYTGVLLSQKRDTLCISLRVPANYPDNDFSEPALPQVEAETLAEWRNLELHFSKNLALQALHDFTGQIQIVEASADEQVPHQTVQNYANAVADKVQLQHVVMEGAPHVLVNGQLRGQYESLLVDWVTSQNL